ncbi:MAG: hypothetical protein GXX96_13905 [Planctomycetaceae bacterium]|nr:hypothetical protein [Planctomycetaceae bacterium]
MEPVSLRLRGEAKPGWQPDFPMSLEYIIYTDESDKKGKFYSNFYGGVLVRSVDLQGIIDRLEARKILLNMHQEVKWQKVTGNYLEKYKSGQDEAKKITPCSLCLTACPKWNLGLWERQGSKELSAEGDGMSTRFLDASENRGDCGVVWSACKGISTN